MARALLALGAAALAAAPGTWHRAAPVPTPRTEVAAAAANGEAIVVGGYLADGSTSGRAEAYSPRTNRWRRLPDLPLAVNHAAAGSWRGRMLVAGGYTNDGTRHRPRPGCSSGAAGGGCRRCRGPRGDRRARRGRHVLRRRRRHRLAARPGAGDEGYALDLRQPSWRTIPGPTPREHLAATAWRGRVYAIGGRLAGYDTNLAFFETYDPAAGRWRRLAAGAGGTRRHRRGRGRRPDRLRRRRGTDRDAAQRLRVRGPGAPLAPPGRPAHAAPRPRRDRARRPCPRRSRAARARVSPSAARTRA